MTTTTLILRLVLLAAAFSTPSHASGPVFGRDSLRSSLFPSDYLHRLWNGDNANAKRSNEEFDIELYKREGGINYNPDGSPFLWLPEDDYSGKNFFDSFDFFHWRDPTEGHVNYINRTLAFERGLAYVTDDNKIVMKSDNTTKLAHGVYRDSVRINTKKTYTTGLFILDLDKAPWGCAIWPAFWSTGYDWPRQGEIDVLEGVHDDEHNQVAWHTTDGCHLDDTARFSGTIPNNRTNCYHGANSNSGCNIVEWSRASYGPYFEQQGGGILVMKWDENDISIWSFFRAAIPKDITAGSPNPSEWGIPSATLRNTKCDINKYFEKHTVIFDITICGVWAGASYATSGCPGTCEERLMEPSNFVNASWSINSLKVYKKHLLAGNITLIQDGASSNSQPTTIPILALLMATCVAAFELLSIF